MIRVTLKQAQGWKGKFYPAGKAEIPEDLAAALGLSEHPPEQETAKPAPAPPPEPTTQTDPRAEELNALIQHYQAIYEDGDWQTIKSKAQQAGIQEKPEGGWDEAIPAIAKHELGIGD